MLKVPAVCVWGGGHAFESYFTLLGKATYRDVPVGGGFDPATCCISLTLTELQGQKVVKTFSK